MEFALNPAALGMALGPHPPGVLPSVPELIDLIADVEIRAFRRDFAVSDELLRTAWYLHGVASAAEAADLYSPARQRRAFAVSAHIFDLALAEAARDRHTRLTLAFGAQTGYRGADLDPNATAVYRRVADLLSEDPDLVGHADTLALEAGVAFLGLDTPRLAPLLRTWRRQLKDLAATVGLDDDLGSTMFGPGQRVVRAVSSMLSFLTFGDRTQLQDARDALRSVLDRRAGLGDFNARWVAGHLLALTDGLEAASVWSVLPDGTPPVVAQAFSLGEPAVLTLWPPQRELLRRARLNPLDPATRRLMLSVPTSAGKTLLAQLIICTHLATQPGGVCYITPLRSLGREMRRALASRLRVLNQELGSDLPDYAVADLDALFEALARAERNVEVMTPERLMQLLRRDAEAVLQRFSLIVVDEAHLLAQPGRGFLLESLLGHLAERDARLVLLSGVLGNAASLASWLTPGEPEVLYTSEWRGPRRMHALLYATPLWDRAERTARRSSAAPTRLTVPLAAHLRLRPAEARTVTLTTDVTQPLGVLALNEARDGTRKRDGGDSTPFYRVAATAAAGLLHAGSLLMIVSTRQLARNAAQALAEQLPPTTASRDLVAFLRERLGGEHPLIGSVRHGVAYHHAGLPVDVLDAIEDGLRTEQLVAVVATSTLTDGVNLPVRTVVIAESSYEGQQAGGKLDAPRLLNAIGRAGRAGRESEGWIVLALAKHEDDADFRLLRPEAEALEARSTLISEEALEALAEAEALLAQTADALFRLPLGILCDFTGYVWFVLTALERAGRLPHAVDLEDALGNLLGFQQMEDSLRRRWLALAERVRGAYDTTPADQRQRWTATGTSLGTAAQLDALAEQVTAAVLERERELFMPATDDGAVELTLGETVDVLAGQDVFNTLLRLPEADRSWRFRPSPRAKATLKVPVVPALRDWLAGFDMPKLAERMMPEVSAEWRLEQTVDAVSSAFEHYLAWTVGVLLDQVNARLTVAGARTRLRQDAAWCIRYGVDSPQALALLTEGIRSRRLAQQVGRSGAAEGMSLPELRNWLASLHIAGWREQFAATPREVLDLLQFTRSRRQSLLRTLLETGSASVDLRRTEAAAPLSEITRPVTIAVADVRPAELRVLDGGEVIGVVDAGAHADVEAVLSSGLDITTVLQGGLVVLTAPDVTAPHSPAL